MIHVYELRDGEPHPIAECIDDALAFTLRTLRDERQLTASSKIGILDRPDADGPGVWLVNPWAAGGAT